MKKSLLLAALCSLTLASGAALAAPPLTKLEQLGRNMYMDKNLSLNSTQSCATCHHRNYGFVDPTNSRDPYNTVVSLGDDGVSKGGRNAPTAAYVGYSPNLNNDNGFWEGGMFWDGRATGDTLGDPLAEQAQGPPLNPVEMNMESAADVIERIAASNYASKFLAVFGADAFGDPDLAYANMARAIAAYERSPEITAFTSRFDTGNLNNQELRGQALVQKNCSKCHTTDAAFAAPGPLFTNYRYENIGVPVNEALFTDPGSVYTVPDLGLGGIVLDPAEDGKFKVPTLRNIALTAPYSHNGYFPNLTAMVSFHNSRDVDTTWPEPEVAANLNTTDVGNMGLNAKEIEDIVAFLHALTD